MYSIAFLKNLNEHERTWADGNWIYKILILPWNNSIAQGNIAPVEILHHNIEYLQSHYATLHPLISVRVPGK